jgi:putative ABC transport system permease protein
MVERSELVVSSIALMSMLVACLGVANMIVAGIDARQFEFGVMRAIGASRGAVLRLVLAEAVIVAVAACIVGTGMGIQAVWAGQKIDALIVGIVLSPRPPWGAVTVGWGIVLVVTVGAALPAVLSLGRRRPRELLAATRG